MRTPKKHLVEDVEKAIKEAEEHHDEPQVPGIKIVVNIGGPPMSTHSRKPMRRKVMKAQKKEIPKAKKRKGVIGPMEEALKGAY